MKKYILSTLFLMAATLQTAWAQGFRVYNNDGTVLQFSLRTDSIVFYDGIGIEQDLGLFTPMNQCVVGTWYKSKSESVTFNEDGTTDYNEYGDEWIGGNYEFFPFQGNLVIHSTTRERCLLLHVPKLTKDAIIMGRSGVSDKFYVYTRTQPEQRISEIILSDSQFTISINGSKRLTATISPTDADNNEVIWSSSDESIATVDQIGNVTAKAKGTCTITCSATDGSGIKAECRVTVIQLVTGITLSETSLSLATGSSQTLTATIEPPTASNLGITWSSNDTSVASVDQTGKVTAKAKGTCIITCSANDGSCIKAECQVTVIQLVTSIALSETSITLQLDETKTLTTTVLPKEADNKSVTWESSNEDVAEVNAKGRVIANANGICFITCSATDGSGIKATCEVMVGEFHEYVDLGLPSGTLWATCNVGASSPEECGDYIAWGETTGYKDGKTTFDWRTYKYCEGSNTTMTKYCIQSSYVYNGFTDGLTELLPEDDAATAIWGIGWQMPSLDQCEELYNSNYTTTEWMTENGAYGIKITSNSNGNSIFLPAAGSYHDASPYNVGSWGYYWSRSLHRNNSGMAYLLYFCSVYTSIGRNDGRFDGRCVRPVRKQQKLF